MFCTKQRIDGEPNSAETEGDALGAGSAPWALAVSTSAPCWISPAGALSQRTQRCPKEWAAAIAVASSSRKMGGPAWHRAFWAQLHGSGKRETGKYFQKKEWWAEVKSLSRVRLCDPMDGGLPGSSIHGIFQARVLEWGCHFLLQEIFPTQGLNPYYRQTLYPLSHQGSSGRWWAKWEGNPKKRVCMCGWFTLLYSNTTL